MKPVENGNQATVFLSADNTILKQYRENSKRLPRAEAASLRLMAHFQIVTPRFIGFERVDQSRALRMTYVDGSPLEEDLWTESGAGVKVGVAMGQLHAKIHSTTLGKIPVAGFESPPEARVLFSNAVETVGRADQSINTESLLTLNQTAKVVCHGDLHPRNIMGPIERPTVIDWCDSYIGSRESDVALTIVRLRTVRLDPNAFPAEELRFTENLVQLESAYLSSYQKGLQLDRSLIQIWGKIAAEATKRRLRSNDSRLDALIENFEPRWS